MNGWELLATMSPPDFSKSRPSPTGVFWCSSSPVVGYKSSSLVRFHHTQTRRPSQCITILTTSMTSRFESGITLFPEYTSASTATLWIRIKTIDIRFSRHLRITNWPLNGLKPLGQSSTPTTLCQTTAYLACIPCLASGDSAPPV